MCNRNKNNWYSTTNVPSVVCPNETDRFSVGSNVARINYPVGLLTADEVIMAGAPGNLTTSNTSYYLYTGNYYWSLSPLRFYSFHPQMSSVNDGLFSSDVGSISSLRPVVSLKPKIEFETGGDGTPTNPYVVKYD